MTDAERVHYRNHAPIVLGIATNAPITHELELAFDKALTEWQKGNCHDLEGCRCITAYMIRHVMPVIRSERERVRQEYIALLKSVDPFSGGRDSDMCLWCQRAARSIYRFEQNFDPEYHYANCDLIRALADRS